MSHLFTIGVAGAGTMGAGIAEVAALAGHSVLIYDPAQGAKERFYSNLQKSNQKKIEKGKLSENEAAAITSRLQFTNQLHDFASVDFFIEAIVENIEIKKELFKNVEAVVKPTTILASNTSSLSIASIAGSCQHPERVIGVHFFNPATLMPLVEIIPGITTEQNITETTLSLIKSWGKITVLAKDTPGFIVNRIARPFYGEAIRIFEEGIATIETIDYALKTKGGFKMGPFELTDFIGHDVNFAVTETVFREFWFDPRYKPSFTQKRLVEAGRLGRKTGRGFYNYAENAEQSNNINMDEKLHENIVNRVLAMLINEAADALHLNIASRDDIDLAMTKGVNYPKGLLAWCDEKGVDFYLSILDQLYADYHEDRYRASVLLRKMKTENRRFY